MNKEWPMSHALPNPGLPANHDPQHFASVSSVEHGYQHPFPHGAPVHPPMHHTAPGSSGSYLPQDKSEADARLPGGPRPGSPTRPGPYSSFPAAPYLPVGRKRNRSDSLFPPENGPFFSSTKTYDNLFALDRTTMLMLRIQSKMDRGFFLADNDWTCYRRNYFQVSSAFSIHGLAHLYPDHEPQCLVRSEDGTLHNVRGFLLGISACVSKSDKKVDLVQHTPKRDKGPQTTPMPKPITPGGNLSMSSVSTNQNIVTFERIQFKTATANNGKRRAAQQYYVCITELYAQTEQGESILVASCQSAPLVVRGRSPGHYADGQDRETRSPVNGQHAPSATPAQPPHPSPIPHPGGHDDHRFNPGFPRPPYTPPSMMPGEYAPPYPYYPNYATFGAPMPHPMMMGSAPPTPTPQQSGPPSASYMMADNASSQASSPHLYNSDYHHPHAMGDNKLQHPNPPPSNGGLNIQVPMEDWQRQRIHSPQQEQQAPSYFTQGTPTLSSANSQHSAFSPTTPTTPYVAARKFNSVPNICNQPSS